MLAFSSLDCLGLSLGQDNSSADVRPHVRQKPSSSSEALTYQRLNLQSRHAVIQNSCKSTIYLTLRVLGIVLLHWRETAEAQRETAHQRNYAAERCGKVAWAAKQCLLEAKHRQCPWLSRELLDSKQTSRHRATQRKGSDSCLPG